MPSVSLVSATGSVGRRNRNPRHNFAVTGDPWSIIPFMCAPVLAGETMKSLLYQGTTNLEAILPSMSGWWTEVYFFYVKHRDLQDRDKITDMHVLNQTDPSLITTGANAAFNHATGINWAQMCYKRVVEEYFRDEGEAWDAAVDSVGYARAKLNRDNWLDSAQVADHAPDTDIDLLPGDKLEETTYQDKGVPVGFENHYDVWFQMRRSRLIEVDFEDYLKAQGIRVPKEDTNPHRPELIRYVQDWQAPRVWSVGTTGEQAASVKWIMQERADKDRFFSEPGFVFGVQVTRPKVYYAGIAGSATGLLKDAFTWLPAVLRDNPETSLRHLTAAECADLLPYFDTAAHPDGIWIDVRDLFLYGEDFTNINNRPVLTGTIATTMGPDANLARRYPTDFDVMALGFYPNPQNPSDPEEQWTYPSLGPSGDTHRWISEGVVTLTIASRIADTSGYGGQA